MIENHLLSHYELIADAPEAIIRLRRFILDLAVRGKLVPQDPRDEPASELIKRIAVEKARLVKAGEVRDKPALPAVVEDDMPFNVPAAWYWVRFANIADFSAGRTPSRSDTSFWNNGDHAWVSIADMVDGQALTCTKETVSNKARERVFGSEPEAPGTIIMSFKLTIGKIARLGVPAFHNEAIISIRPHLVDLDAYLFKVLPQFARQGNTKGAIKGATLNRDSISNILFPLPPLAEQRRIVTKVDTLMALCDRLEAAESTRDSKRDQLAAATLARLNAPDPETYHDDVSFALDALPALTTRRDQIKQLRQTILNLAVRGKLVPQDPTEEPVSVSLRRANVKAVKSKDPETTTSQIETWAGQQETPAGWRWIELGEVIESMTNGIYKPSSFYSDSGTACVRMYNIQNGALDLAKLQRLALVANDIERYRLSPGDLLVNRVNSREPITSSKAGGLIGNRQRRF